LAVSAATIYRVLAGTRLQIGGQRKRRKGVIAARLWRSMGWTRLPAICPFRCWGWTRTTTAKCNIHQISQDEWKQLTNNVAFQTTVNLLF
jgi:hypothetical protein